MSNESKKDWEGALAKPLYGKGLASELLELAYKENALLEYMAKKNKEWWDDLTPSQQAQYERKWQIEKMKERIRKWWIRLRLACVGLSYYYDREDDWDD